MRDLDQQPRIDFSERPIDQVASWLDRRTPQQALALVFGAMAVVAGLDFSSGLYDLRMATLYIVPISLACWMFRPRFAIAMTAALTMIAFARYSMLEGASLYMSIANGFSRAVAFGLLAAIVLGFRRAFDHMRIAASRDRMTGALNKTAFQQRTRILLDRARSAGKTVLLLYLDLDGFKAINDRHGHYVGDQVLDMFAAGAAQGLRRGDCFGRLGGDEFAVAMAIDTGDDAQGLAGKLHERFSSALRNTGHVVTCSTGALAIPPDCDVQLDELLREADRLMYAAKHGGKDGLRFSAAAPPIPVRPSAPILPASFGETSEVGGSA